MSNLQLYSDLPSCSNTLATWCEEVIHWKRPWCWERLRAGGEGVTGWDGWMASLTQWTWVWASSGRWRRTGKPGRLQSMGSQRVRHDLATEWQVLPKMAFIVSLFRWRFSQRPSIMLGVLVAKVSQSWLQTTSLPTICHHILPQPVSQPTPICHEGSLVPMPLHWKGFVFLTDLCLAALGLHCCMWAFSTCGVWASHRSGFLLLLRNIGCRECRLQ